MASEYFEYFQECNGFPHDPENDYMDEFENLAAFFHWGDKAMKRNRKNFLEILENQTENTTNNRSRTPANHPTERNRTIEDFDIDSFESIEDYFAYYKRNYKFRPRKHSPLDKFKELAGFMGWNNRKSQEWQKIKRNKDATLRKNLLCELMRKNDMNYNNNYSLERNFDDLCDFQG